MICKGCENYGYFGGKRNYRSSRGSKTERYFHLIFLKYHVIGMEFFSSYLFKYDTLNYNNRVSHKKNYLVIYNTAPLT